MLLDLREGLGLVPSSYDVFYTIDRDKGIAIVAIYDNMTKHSGFLSKRDKEDLSDGLDALSSQSRADRKYNIRRRAAMALRDFEIVANELEPDDFGQIAVEWFGLNTDRSPPERLPDIFRLLWVGLNLKTDAGRDGDYVEMGEGEVVKSEEVRRGYGPRDWENWIERAIRQSQPTAYVDVQISTYTDEQLDELEDEYRTGEGVSTREIHTLAHTGRIEWEEYMELGGPGLGPLLTEPT